MGKNQLQTITEFVTGHAPRILFILSGYISRRLHNKNPTTANYQVLNLKRQSVYGHLKFDLDLNHTLPTKDLTLSEFRSQCFVKAVSFAPRFYVCQFR